MWFTDNPWPPILICLVAGVFIAVYANSTGKNKAFLVAFAFWIACPVIYAIEKSIITKRETIEQDIYDLAAEFGEGNEPAVIDHISDSASKYRNMVRTGMTKFKVSPTVRITDITVEMQEEGTQALVHFRANALITKEESRSGTVQRRFPSRWEITYQEEPDRWRITHIKRLSPISGKEMPLLAPRFE